MPVNSSSPFARLSRRALTATVMAGALALALPAQAEIKSLDIIAPANPGGGWDQTARAIQAALEADKLASGVKVENIAGAGGTIGLAQFVTSKRQEGRRDPGRRAGHGGRDPHQQGARHAGRT